MKMGRLGKFVKFGLTQRHRLNGLYDTVWDVFM